ncbi:MAG: competence/damage-inducible protein A [Bacteroidales bacterium]|nr:competence/damage-inducible protein A [Bacteroidales bacterium]
MDVEIITIGDELLIGQVVDTNSAWMGKELNNLGFEVARKITIGDDRDELLSAFSTALSRVDVVLVTGGIGPTKDDITKKTLCEFFETELVFNEDVLSRIEVLFAGRNIKINELTRDQAFVPRDCEVIENTTGTAPITWFERNGKILVSMPGVPFEMKTAMTRDILPRLKARFSKDIHIVHRTFSVKNYPESALALHIEAWENALPDFIRLAYLPSPGVVRLRLTARHSDLTLIETALEKAEQSLLPLLGDSIFSSSDAPISEVLGKLLKKNDLTLAVAESCTGGNIAHHITSISGSSAYFLGGVVSYSNEMKRAVLGVSKDSLEQFGAVSREVALEMVNGIAKLADADVAIATTGIAGPDGGTLEKPVGTVWIAVKMRDEVRVELFRLGKVREANIQRASNEAMLLAAEMIELKFR